MFFWQNNSEWNTNDTISAQNPMDLNVSFLNIVYVNAIGNNIEKIIRVSLLRSTTQTAISFLVIVQTGKPMFLCMAFD